MFTYVGLYQGRKLLHESGNSRLYCCVFLFARSNLGYFSVLLCVLLSAIWSVSFVIMSGRLSKTRIRQSEIGSVDIGVDAIESIALNSAKSAQVGIKSAKAFVSSAKDDSIKVYLSAVLYSNVEIPAMMAKVQDRIKKDIERYTGISVESVSIKVSRVEPIVAKVER